MLRRIFILALCLLSRVGLSQSGDTTTVSTLFLVGDAGEPYVKDSPLGKVLTREIRQSPGASMVLFLGDNIYPAGLPEEHSVNYNLAQSSLKTQAGFIQGENTRGIFIPGNHDWQHWGKKGREYLLNQQQWLDSLKDHRIKMLPRDGCPGPVTINLNDNTILLILDTQWFIHQWDKPSDADLCNATTTAEVLTLVEDVFKTNPGKRIIMAAHHPLVTYGEHGGIFTWKAHIFPLEEFAQHLYIPLPGIGSFYPLYRKWFGHIQDTAHPLNKEFAEALMNIMRQYPGSVYVAGHEHALQYILKDSTHFIVSGSGAKTEYVKEKDYAVFAKDIKGFARLSIATDGSVTLNFFQVDEQYPEGHVVYTRSIAPRPRVNRGTMADIDFRGRSVRIKASDQYAAGSLKQKLLGENYRDAWAQEIDVPVFDIETELGGLKALQKGGGQQTLSLRLADSSGREYVLRSVEKYPAAAIPEALRETFAQDLVQDQISAAHPYAALVVAPMAEKIGLYHTNPRLVYIPDDPALGEYRSTFANTLALFEERPDEDWSHADHFGNSENILSTRKVLEKLAKDNDDMVDERFVLRNRLFDLIIGDWDRHDDQWRWATIDVKKDELYRPIPRDRDQTFFVNEGWLAKIWSRRWALPKFEGFDRDINWPSGLSFNARHFDRTFLTRLSKQDWIDAAETLKKDLTDEIIADALQQWPKEIYDLDGPEIIEKIKARRDNIVSEAISHYEFLAREVEVTGSDKSEAFQVDRLSDGDVHVEVFKISKKGVRERKLYDRVFTNRETREIRLYGLGSDDVFEIAGDSKESVRIRVIGGEGDDVLTDSSRAGGLRKQTLFYDQTGQGKYTSAGEVRDLTSKDATVNEYNRTSFEYDRLAPLVWGQYNPDDRLFVGGGFLFLKQGFRKLPYGQRHLFLATVAPATQSYNFRYQGKFVDFAGKWNLELDADLKSPNYVNNFFGMGNESVFDKEIDEDPAIEVDDAIQYYRYRFEELVLSASVSRLMGNVGTLHIGPIYQRVEMEERDAGETRFVHDYAETISADEFYENTPFAGITWQMDGGVRDNTLFPRRGVLWSLTGRNLAGLTRDNYNFSSYNASLALYHSFRPRARLVFAARVGAGINEGKYPFYQAQVLDGKSALRGYRKTRFYGDSKLYSNIEARLRLLEFRSYLFPASFGVLAFYDVGRVWYKNENGLDPTSPDGNSDAWHRGAGGGIWFTPFNFTVLSVEAARSSEGTLGYIRLGFQF